MIKSNYIVFDCETGGLDCKANPITQYAGIILDGCTFKEIDRWETFVKPYDNLKIEKQALDATMVSMSDINSGISVNEFVKFASEWWESHRTKAKNRDMGRLIPVGHNIPFDLGFLSEAFRIAGWKYGIHEYLYPNFIDTFAIAKMTWGKSPDRNEKLNLTACTERAKIKLVDAHGAMNDSESTAELFRWFMKKLRSSKTSVSEAAEEVKKRSKGEQFFEFKCAAK